MAKPLEKINKTVLYHEYNLVDVYDGVTLMKSLSNIKPNHFYAEYKHKRSNDEAPA
ncbi:MAG: hypothetical protein MJ219_01830 [Mycoplasmoidaceae bacterium]|nr:hypothetical protein [Mycoplasmoidaceae bacterium]